MTRIGQWLCCAGVAGIVSAGANAIACADPLAAPSAYLDTVDLPFEEPFDLTTPMPQHFQNTIDPARFTLPAARTDWSAKVGVDNRSAGPDAEFRPERWLPGLPQQSIGVGWANVSAPGVLTWDKTSVETRLDPDQQGRFGVTLSRSLPIGHGLSVTLQNGYAVTQPLVASGAPLHPTASPQPLPGVSTAVSESGSAEPILEGNHAIRFTMQPSDTTFSFGASNSSADDRWLRRLSAEQKLFGGPVNITGAVSETPTGELSKSLTAGFKQSW